MTFILIFITFHVWIKGISSLSVITQAEIDVSLGPNSSIELNCTFALDGNERVNHIVWSKGNVRLAQFDLNGAYYSSEEFKVKYKLITYKNDSPSAILIINDVKCEDGGNYQCVINILKNSFTKEFVNYTKVSIKVDPEAPISFSMHPNTSLEEYDDVNLSCVANVGHPGGWLTIIRLDSPNVQLGNGSFFDIKTENCSSMAHLSVRYSLRQQDFGANFRCYSQNNQSLHKDFGPIEFFYGPSDVTIGILPNNTNFESGTRISLHCFSKGNPDPSVQWKLNSTDLVNNTKYTIYDTALSFVIDSSDESETYTCIASNYFNNKTKRVSTSLILKVQEQSNNFGSNTIKSCLEDPCTLIEICSQRGESGNATCSLNAWKLISFVFIALTLIFGTITTGLIFSARISKGQVNNNVNLRDVHVSYTREKLDDFGGYTDPKDVKRPDNREIKSDKDGRDNPYADPVDFQTQYAVVQKTWATTANSSNDKNSPNLPNDMDLSNTANLSSSPETTNPKNSSSDEKTPGLTETSETIPRPPNVYDDAWV